MRFIPFGLDMCSQPAYFDVIPDNTELEPGLAVDALSSLGITKGMRRNIIHASMQLRGSRSLGFMQRCIRGLLGGGRQEAGPDSNTNVNKD